jgi:hypothetical protein
MLATVGSPSPELMAVKLYEFLGRRSFAARGALLHGLVAHDERYRPLLTLLLLTHSANVLAPLLVHAASRPDADRALSATASLVLEDLVDLEGGDLDEWSPAAHALGVEISGFLAPEVLATRIPLTLLLHPAAPGVAPCRFQVVVDEMRVLQTPEHLATFFGLLPEWRGSLRDLTHLARSI